MARHDHRDVSSSKAQGQPASEQGAQPRGSEPQLDLEDLAIDRDGEIPIGVQLAWALRARIGDGRLASGQRLPGLRELAEMVGINANTARAVYQRLEQEGLIDSRQGTGTFVATIAREPSAVGQIAADAARQARKTGVDPREVAAALYVTGEAPAQGTAQASERRRELRIQITALEQALSEIQARHPGLLPNPTQPLRQAGPRLLSAQELERVRTELVRRLAAAEPLLDTSEQEASSRAWQSEVGASSQADQAGQVKSVEPVKKKAARTRPRTRPSTA
jgi:DNA-binding transcriptional regulator YhcF (GntR family)